MIDKRISRTGQFFQFLLLLAGLVAISYCKTTNRTASEFDKRRYTPGHFSDPDGRLSMQYTPAKLKSEDAQTASRHGANPEKETDATKEPVQGFTSSGGQRVPGIIIAVQKRLGMKIAAPPQPGNNQVVIVPNTVGNPTLSPPHSDYIRDNHERPGKAAGLLTGWLVCLGIAVICWILIIGWAINAPMGSSTQSGYGYASTGCALVTLGIFAFIAAIVLFILWLVALAGS